MSFFESLRQKPVFLGQQKQPRLVKTSKTEVYGDIFRTKYPDVFVQLDRYITHFGVEDEIFEFEVDESGLVHMWLEGKYCLSPEFF